jgi:hypothetical protein
MPFMMTFIAFKPPIVYVLVDQLLISIVARYTDLLVLYCSFLYTATKLLCTALFKVRRLKALYG